MKKLLILTLVLFSLSLSACSLNKDNRGEEISGQTNQPNIIGGEVDSLKVNDSISSEKLGIKVSYYSNPENKTESKVDGNRIYFYMNGPANVSDYKSGQYLEEFTKETDSSLQGAIENNFLQNINKDTCFVEIIEDTAEYQKAIINYPNTPCPDGSPAFTCTVCPAGYSRTNGISYFIYYKNNPNLYFYLSIGQYSLMGGSQASSSLEWFNNIEFLK